MSRPLGPISFVMGRLPGEILWKKSKSAYESLISAVLNPTGGDLLFDRTIEPVGSRSGLVLELKLPVIIGFAGAQSRPINQVHRSFDGVGKASQSGQLQARLGARPRQQFQMRLQVTGCPLGALGFVGSSILVAAISAGVCLDIGSILHGSLRSKGSESVGVQGATQ